MSDADEKILPDEEFADTLDELSRLAERGEVESVALSEVSREWAEQRPLIQRLLAAAMRRLRPLPG